ncbi:MAG: hypothetical protein ACR2HF_07720 [Methylococcaceae bacterium]
MTPLTPLILILLLAMASAKAEDDDHVKDHPFGSDLILSPEQDAAAGLVLATLEPGALGHETIATGKVLDIHPLLNLRSRYHQAEAEATTARVTLALALKNRSRITALYDEHIVAGRVVAEVDSQYQSSQAQSQAAHNRVAEVRDEAVQNLGPELARLILNGDSPLLKDWIHQRRALLLISLPQRHDNTPDNRIVLVSRDLNRDTAKPAYLISKSPATDDLTQAETFYYHTEAEGLRSGMRVHVRVVESGAAEPGVVVPYAAIVWQGGLAWVYRERSPRHYARIEIGEHLDRGADWQVSEGLSPGDRLVVRGAQSLLSEELKRQIPDEDDD